MDLEFYKFFFKSLTGLFCEGTSVLAQAFCSVVRRRSEAVVNQDGNSLRVAHVGLRRPIELLRATESLSLSWKMTMSSVCTCQRHVGMQAASEAETHTH